MSTAAPPRNPNAVLARPERDAVAAFQRELDGRREVIEQSAASLVDADRFRGVVLASFTRNPGLWECDPVTVARAVVEAAQLGLEPTGTLGGAYLVPYKNKRTGRKEAQLIIGYRGLTELARRSGEIQAVQARIVREKDAFDYAYGLVPRLEHVPFLGTEDPGKMTHVYGVVVYRSGHRDFDVMSAAEVDVIRRRSRSNDDGPWVTDYFEMAKKTVVRRMAKLWPLTVEARDVIAREDEFEDAKPAPTRRAAETVRSRLQARLGAVEPEPEAIAPGAAPEPATPAPDEVPDPECGSPSPFEAGAACIRPTGHAGNHQATSRESWA